MFQQDHDFVMEQMEPLIAFTVDIPTLKMEMQYTLNYNIILIYTPYHHNGPLAPASQKVLQLTITEPEGEEPLHNILYNPLESIKFNQTVIAYS